ncbi:YggT family protein [Nakamurella deserti]|uniref:YggT family protein n=1 Tax=Nakamurella deserti TaxID=2164074 RepID=UPI000DBE0F26|nr:YggT family protein [Nakamurella deserti]
MNIFWQIVYLVLWAFYMLLIGRLLLEFVRMFARSWMPSGRSAIAVESVYTVTDPPVKALRRLIPMVRIGGFALDLSLIILFLVLSWLLLPLVASLAISAL